LQDKKISAGRYRAELLYIIDGDKIYIVDEISLHCACHELTHGFWQQGHAGCDTNLDNLELYGLMNYNDRRSYLHAGNIIRLRDSLSIFDRSDF